MKFAARRGADHAGPHGALRIDGMLLQRQCVAAITYDRCFEARGRGRMAGLPVQRRRGLATGLPARQR